MLDQGKDLRDPANQEGPDAGLETRDAAAFRYIARPAPSGENYSIEDAGLITPARSPRAI